MIEKLIEIKDECKRLSNSQIVGSAPFAVYLAAMDLHTACVKMIKALGSLKPDVPKPAGPITKEELCE